MTDRPHTLIETPGFIDKALSRLIVKQAQMEHTTRFRNRIGALVKRAEYATALAPTPSQDKVRIIHHMATTGGTLWTKCIASMLNTLVLNEIDPLSTIYKPIPNKQARFAPTDMIELMYQGDRNMPRDAAEGLFLSQLNYLHEKCHRQGRALVLREHSHSHFMFGPIDKGRPTMKALVERKHSVLSLITVRHPLESYASCLKNNWHQHFTPSTLDEYCRRYLLFLDHHSKVSVLKYEDFVREPMKVMEKTCEVLSLKMNNAFLDIFYMFQFSGDSGRSGRKIEPRTKQTDEVFRKEARMSPNYSLLVDRLGYEQI